MGHNTTIGQKGEAVAATYLQDKGYKIITLNYRYKRAEVDVIAQLEKVLVLVEVKTRSTDKFGFPEEAVTPKKQEMLHIAAESLIEEMNWQHDVRFDVVSIIWHQTGPQILHIEDAFH